MITAKYHQSKNQIAEEESLIRKAQEDSAAFEPLYTAYYKRILEFSYKRLNTVDDARDVTQQVFLNALTNLKNYECRGLPFSSWLFRIALNEMNSHFRKTKKFRAVNLDTVSLGHLVSEMWPVRDYLLIEMRFFEQRAFKEIAEILEITENNAKVKTYRALDRLKVAFNTTNH
jgi:RNA polymerase sigma-70 factor, ECF subfamily